MVPSSLRRERMSKKYLNILKDKSYFDLLHLMQQTTSDKRMNDSFFQTIKLILTRIHTNKNNTETLSLRKNMNTNMFKINLVG